MYSSAYAPADHKLAANGLPATRQVHRLTLWELCRGLGPDAFTLFPSSPIFFPFGLAPFAFAGGLMGC